ncbi:hypothetical protein [Gordonia caeni]|uniref:DUF4878 domain-containing protein n=1 Tax=Gordonia caeni TaxID=1007097 RepID=A0ABP7NVL9_9ACTN
MSDQTPGGADYPDDPQSPKRTPDGYPEKFAEEFGDPDPGRSRWPFLAAVGVVLTLVAVVVVIALVNPPEDRVNDSTRVQYVVNDAYSARNSLNYEQYRNAHCEQEVQSADFPTAAQFADENRVARDENGLLVIPTMDVDVEGDTATVTVHWHREDTPDDEQTTTLTVVRQGDEWKVCNP